MADLSASSTASVSIGGVEYKMTTSETSRSNKKNSNSNNYKS